MRKNLIKQRIGNFNIVLIVLTIGLSINIVSSLEVNLDINDSFSIGEKVYFNYSLISDNDEIIKFIPYISCQREPVALLKENTINLESNKIYYNIYEETFSNNFISQECFANIIITRPVYQKFSKKFHLNGKNSFKFELIFDKKVYSLGDNVNINYETDVIDSVISASLKYPDGNTEDIIIPTLIKSTQIGTYELNVIVSKEGYKTITKKEQFGVIDKQIRTLGVMGINDASVCNADGICNNNENNQNCPQDCPPTTGLAETYDFQNRLILYIILLSFIEVILIVSIYLIYKSLKKS